MLQMKSWKFCTCIDCTFLVKDDKENQEWLKGSSCSHSWARKLSSFLIGWKTTVESSTECLAHCFQIWEILSFCPAIRARWHWEHLFLLNSFRWTSLCWRVFAELVSPNLFLLTSFCWISLPQQSFCRNTFCQLIVLPKLFLLTASGFVVCIFLIFDHFIVEWHGWNMIFDHFIVEWHACFYRGLWLFVPFWYSLCFGTPYVFWYALCVSVRPMCFSTP